MPKKLKLTPEYNYKFQLYGIVSEAKEYTLSWSINKSAFIELKKEDDLLIGVKGKGKIEVSNYSYSSDLLNIYLIKNTLELDNSINQKFFIPSMWSFDYILKIETEDNQPISDDLFMQIRKTDKIQSILKLDVNKIKEKEYFLF